MADIDRYRDKEKRMAYLSEQSTKYAREHYKRISLRLRTDTDADILDHLDNLGGVSVNQYIVGLIRADMESKK